MKPDRNFQATQEQKLKEAAKRPASKEAASVAIAPDQLTRLKNTVQVHRTGTYNQRREAAISDIKLPTDQAWMARYRRTDAPGEGGVHVGVTVSSRPLYSRSSYFATLEKEFDYYRYLRLLKLWMGAGVQLNSPVGAAWWAKNAPEVIAREVSKQMPYEMEPLAQFETPLARRISTKNSAFHYAMAVRRFPEVLMYHVMSKAMMIAKASKYTDQPSLLQLYTFAVNRLDADIEETKALLNSTENIQMYVGGMYVADVQSSIPVITLTPEIVPWLPRNLNARQAILYAMNQTRWLIRAQIEKLGSQVVALSTPGVQTHRHPSLTDSSENIFLVYDPAATQKKGDTTFQDVSVQASTLVGPRTVTVDRSDPSQAWVPTAEDFELEKALRVNVKRTIDVEGGTTLSPDEARSLGLPVPEEKGSMIPWAIAGVAAAAVASQVL